MARKVGAGDTAAIDQKMTYEMAYTKTKRPMRGAVSDSLAGQKVCQRKLSMAPCFDPGTFISIQQH
jgi:hypothetical protein